MDLPFTLLFDLSLCSPSGKLVQIEHALTAVGSGQTSLGIKGYVLSNMSSLFLFVLYAFLDSNDKVVNLGFPQKFHLSDQTVVKLFHRITSNGVVIATEKKLPSILVDETSVQKIQLMTTNIGVVYSCFTTMPLMSFRLCCSGMGPDSRVLVRKSRKQAQQYFRLYKEAIPVTQLVRETAAVMQEFTQSGFQGQISSKNIEIGIIGADRKFRCLLSSSVVTFDPS
ncbi:hypothetical protein BHE74_00002597 [Ensete ventricosum]|uniref:Uncharacterized protein n=1 Tax=Ensete ventricosum TaxID=4639 RepID=A0A444CG30_ENSVE|nr:hypothetical protein GW17_00053395 [Ensete ventricosum]RWW88527.1 hypothetical protein BHE74_00002597 [Ensete ventricosum]RZR70897.1 hypothetical protein BHM03_00002139 [Ensete ventricosum]